jgi:hypothetical protein
MMDIVEKQAKDYVDTFYGGSLNITLELLKSRLGTQLYNFNRDRDRLRFATILREETLREKEDHFNGGCKKSDCWDQQRWDLGLFVIEQEIEELEDSTISEPNDPFSFQERLLITQRLDAILENYDRTVLGQEIIFEEIQTLKENFDLGKKSWFQLAKSKFFDLSVDGIIDRAIVAGLYTTLVEGFNAFVKMLPTL